MEDLVRIGIPPNSFMPELPEVETVKSVLLKIVIGRKITAIDVLRDCTIVGDESVFVNSLIGKTFLSITRIGKFLIFHLSDDVVFISHLRMEGKYFEVLEDEPNTKYSRVVFHLDNGHKLCYDDSRCFGMMKLSNEKDYMKLPDIAKLGPEPFFINDINYLIDRTKKNSGPIKSTLLDQTLMTGLGNIYADEVLFRSQIHPLTPTNKITKVEWKSIVKNAQDILNDAIREGGSTIRSYHPGKDIDGNFQSALQAYGKADTPCPRCGTLMRFIKVGGRGTTFCPHCQQRKAKQLLIAIYGKVASGKSTVLDLFKANGAVTISSDDIVKDLYNKKDVAKLFNKTFGFTFGDTVDKNILRKYLLDNPKDIKKVNKIIHPLVKQEVATFIKNHKNGLVVVEVPLLYESKMDNMFDYVIAVDIDKKVQAKRLEKRNGELAKDLEKINSEHKFDTYKEKADIIISNNGSLSDLESKSSKVINKLKDRLN